MDKVHTPRPPGFAEAMAGMKEAQTRVAEVLGALETKLASDPVDTEIEKLRGVLDALKLPELRLTTFDALADEFSGATRDEDAFDVFRLAEYEARKYGEEAASMVKVLDDLDAPVFDGGSSSDDERPMLTLEQRFTRWIDPLDLDMGNVVGPRTDGQTFKSRLSEVVKRAWDAERRLKDIDNIATAQGIPACGEDGKVTPTDHRVGAMVNRLSVSECVYCKFAISNSEPDTTFDAHVKVCAAHPMREVEQRAGKAQADVIEAQMTLARINSHLDLVGIEPDVETDRRVGAACAALVNMRTELNEEREAMDTLSRSLNNGPPSLRDMVMMSVITANPPHVLAPLAAGEVDSVERYAPLADAVWLRTEAILAKRPPVEPTGVKLFDGLDQIEAALDDVDAPPAVVADGRINEVVVRIHGLKTQSVMQRRQVEEALDEGHARLTKLGISPPGLPIATRIDQAHAAWEHDKAQEKRNWQAHLEAERNTNATAQRRWAEEVREAEDKCATANRRSAVLEQELTKLKAKLDEVDAARAGAVVDRDNFMFASRELFKGLRRAFAHEDMTDILRAILAGAEAAALRGGGAVGARVWEVTASHALQLMPTTWHCSIAFAVAMEEQLEANRHKGDRPGWLASSAEDLLARLREEVDELAVIVNTDKDRKRAREEAADVGNFAMMVADKLGGLFK